MKNILILLTFTLTLSCGIKKELKSVKEQNTQLSERVQKLEAEQVKLEEQNKELYKETQDCRRESARLIRESNRLKGNNPSSSINDEIFTVVEKMPQYPGGQDKLYKFISKNVIYPETARENGIDGIVYVQFVVEKDGSVSNIKVIRGIGGGCDEEAVRVTKLIRNWNPGTQRGKAVRTKMVLPFSFKLT